MALQYRRSATGGGGKSAAVDWELFEETLARVDPCFSDPRFDSLKHVLTVLSSSNAEQEVAEVGMGRSGGPQGGAASGMAALHGRAACLPCQLLAAAHQLTKPCCRAVCHYLRPLLPAPSSVCPLLQLQEQRAAIEEMVDAVVEGYHAGFNKSIHNYSLILRLFTESRLQVRRQAC